MYAEEAHLFCVLQKRDARDEAIQLLNRLDIKGSYYTEDQDRGTCLIQAAYYGHLDLVQMLLAKGNAVDKTDRLGCSALMWASCEGHIQVCGWLLEQGADANLRDVFGYTALAFAVTNDDLHPNLAIPMLIEHGAQVDVYLDNQETLEERYRAKTSVYMGRLREYIQEEDEKLVE